MLLKLLKGAFAFSSRGRRRAFTLVEALVASLIVGYCLLPIVGTMQNAERVSERISHTDKLRILARSRMNLETSAANNEQKPIDTTTAYHFGYYEPGSSDLLFVDSSLSKAQFIAAAPSHGREVVYEYWVEVVVDDDVRLLSDVTLGTQYKAGLKGLKTVVVTATLKANGAEIDEDQSYSLLSLVTVPSISDDYVWTINTENNALHTLDPVTFMMNMILPMGTPGTYDDKMPIYVYPHPNMKAVITYDNWGPRLINLDNTSPNYLATATFYSSISPRYAISLPPVTSPRSHYYENFYSAIRPDGARAFTMKNSPATESATARDGMFLFVDDFEENPSQPTGFSHTSGSAPIKGLGTGTVGRLTAGNDGFLYLFVNRATGNESVIFRAPMYGALSNYGNMTTGVFEAVTNFSDLTVVAIASSYDGQKTYVLTQGPTPTSSNREDWVIEYNSKPWQENRRSIIYVDKNMELTDMAISGDGAYLCLLNNKSSYTRINLYNVENDLRAYRLLGSLMHAAKPSGFNPGRVIYSPIYDQFIISSETDARLLILDVKEFAAGNYQLGIPDERVVGAGDAGSTILHHSVRSADLLYIAVSKGNDYKLLAYDLKAKEFMEDLEINLLYKPTSIKLTPMGDRIIVNYGDAVGYDVYDTKSLDAVYTSVAHINRPKIVDYYPLNDGGQKDSNGKPTGVFLKDANNFELFYKKHDGTFVPESVNIGGWKLKKAIGLNSDGLLTLLGKDTGETMLEWYERDSAGALKKANRWISGVASEIIHSRLIPSKMFMEVTIGHAHVPDTSTGFMFIYRKKNFWIGEKIQRIDFISSYEHASTFRYLTPVLVELQSDNTYRLKDWGQSIGVKTKGNYAVDITWEYGGIIKNSNYLPGVWHGNKNTNSKNAGVISFYQPGSFTGDFYSDIGELSGSGVTTISVNKALKRCYIEEPQSIRDYQVQFLVAEHEKKEAFPPQNVTDMAMARDDRVLALQIKDAGNEYINFYDFGSSNFGLESRLKGMLSDYRELSLYLGATKVSNNLSYNSNLNTLKLTSALTANSTWNSVKTHAANFVEDGVTSNPRLNTNKRFWGYLSRYQDANNGVDKYNETDISDICAYYADNGLTSMILNKFQASDGAPLRDKVKADNTSNHSTLIQLNQSGQGKYVLKKYFTAFSGGSDWAALPNPNVYSINDTGTSIAGVPKHLKNDVFKGHFYANSGNMEYTLNGINTDLYVRVDLLFAELWVNSSNERVFDVKINDVVVESGLDVYRETGGKNRALVKTYYVFPDADKVKLNFIRHANKNNPMISGVVLSYVERGTQTNNRQASGLYYCNDIENGTIKIGAVAKPVTGINAVTAMASPWKTLRNEPFMPFKFEPAYLGKTTLNTALKHWLLYSRDYHYPTLSVFSQINSTQYRRDKKWVTKPGELLLNTGVVKDVALSNVESKMYWIDGQSVKANGLLDNLNLVEEIASFTTSEESLFLATKPFNKYYEKVATAPMFVQVATLPEARWGVNQAVVASGGIYIAGGADPGTNSYDKIYRFDVTSETVHHVGTLPSGIREHSMAAYDDCIYLFNGRWGASNTDATDAVVEFNVNTGVVKHSISMADTVISVSKTNELLSPSGAVNSFTPGQTGTALYENEPDGIIKKVTWRNGQTYNNSFSSIATLQVDKAFDSNATTYWEVFGDNQAGGYRHIKIEYEIPVVIKKLKVDFDNTGLNYVFQGVHLRGSNTSSAVDTPSGASSVINAETMTSGTFYNNSSSIPYKFYRITLMSNNYSKKGKLKEIELRGDYTITSVNKGITRGMHRTKLDDLSSYEIMRNAACTTPYGIIVAGGKPNGGGSENATSTAMVYYPHSTEVADPETGEKLFGLSRSITDLPNGGYLDSSMVWHKGKVYCFGGLNSYQTNAANIHLPAIFDFKTNQWTTATPPTAPHASPSAENWLRRRKAAAVSFGDEIFLFGGVMIGNYVVPGVVAWNPETNGMRKVADNMPEATMNYSVSAVACGSHIYLFGGSNTNHSSRNSDSSLKASKRIYRFTP